MEKEEFLKLLPKLIVEDNEVKGAIITALSGVMATKSDIEKIIEHADKRFEKIDDKFNQIQEILISHTNALTQINERTNNLSANFSRIENIRATEFKKLDGKIDRISEKLDEKFDNVKGDIIEIKNLLKKDK
jgi:methyl-accepting chemotaxis protein